MATLRALNQLWVWGHATSMEQPVVIDLLIELPDYSMDFALSLPV
jgi:hypothetical protein